MHQIGARQTRSGCSILRPHPPGCILQTGTSRSVMWYKCWYWSAQSGAEPKLLQYLVYPHLAYPHLRPSKPYNENTVALWHSIVYEGLGHHHDQISPVSSLMKSNIQLTGIFRNLDWICYTFSVFSILKSVPVTYIGRFVSGVQDSRDPGSACRGGGEASWRRHLPIHLSSAGVHC